MRTDLTGTFRNAKGDKPQIPLIDASVSNTPQFEPMGFQRIDPDGRHLFEQRRSEVGPASQYTFQPC
jgi:hypothetical protein